MPLSSMSAADTCRLLVDTSSDVTWMQSRHPNQLNISDDLLRAIEELRSVPVLRSVDDLRFTSDNDDWVAASTSAPASGFVVQPQLSNHSTTATTITVSSVLTRWSRTDHNVVEQASTAVNGNEPGRAIARHSQPEADDHRLSVHQQTSNVSDSVFFDDVTPLSDDLLIDDVYEREMEELDQLDSDVIVSDDRRHWSVNGFDQPSDEDDDVSVQTADRLVDDSLTDVTECSVSAVEVQGAAEIRRQDDRLNTYASSVMCQSWVDTSAEEVFEEIVESLTDTISDDDEAELDALADANNQRTIDATSTKFGPGTTTDHRFVVSEKFVSDTVLSPLTSESCSGNVEDVFEHKRQKALTVCLTSTLNDCLKALSRLDGQDDACRHKTDVRGYQRSTSDRTHSWSPRSNNSPDDSRHCVTSASSGFQSDLMDVDIDEEFDAAVSGTTQPAAQSTSLDSLLDQNNDVDDDEAYSSETIIRRPIPRLTKRADDHSTGSGFEGKTTEPQQTTVETGMYITHNSTTDVTSIQQVDEDDKKTGSVVACDDKSPKVEVLAEELITQEIVLNIVLPRRSKKSRKEAEVDGDMDRTESVENGVVNCTKTDKTPHRDFHIRRVVRCSDADDRAEDHLAISESPQKSMTECGAAEDDDDVNDDRRSLVDRGGSLASRYVGGPLSVELERNTESATTEQLDDDTSLRVTRRKRVKVLRAPGGSGAALFSAPVSSVHSVVDEVGRTLVTDRLPSGVRVTCDAVERKSSSSLPVDDDVTVVRRTIVDNSDRTPPTDVNQQ